MSSESKFSDRAFQRKRSVYLQDSLESPEYEHESTVCAKSLRFLEYIEVKRFNIDQQIVARWQCDTCLRF
jgi:hypothetical protein